MRIIGSILLALAFLSCSTDSSTRADSNAEPQTVKASADCVTFDFHYLITSDWQMNEKVHEIKIFMDEKAFSEENIKKLFRYLSDKTPARDESENLILLVYTDWKQLGFPSDCPPSGSSGGNSGKDAYDYYWARFYRRGDKESFNFDPVKKVGKVKYVTMKGTEVFANGVWQTPPR